MLASDSLHENIAHFQQKLEALSSESKQNLSEDLENLHSLVEQLEKERDQAKSELEKSNNELRETKSSLKKLNTLKGEFVSICAHDLKSPTTSILSFLEILKTDWQKMSENEVESIFNRINRAGNHMMSLINDLLDMSRIESGKIQFEPKSLLLSTLCQEALTNSAGKFQEKEIQTGLTVHKGEVNVNVDPQKGLQIINNLLGNALKFTPRGGNVQIIISPDERNMVMEIKDSGQGIPDAEQSKLFKQFSKTSTRATEGEKGSGLGLSIVHQLVELHHGKVGVKSKEGKGTSFFVSLPVSEAPVLQKLFSGKK